MLFGEPAFLEIEGIKEPVRPPKPVPQFAVEVPRGLSSDPVPLCGDEDGEDAEPAAAGGHQVARRRPRAGQAAVGMGEVPEVAERPPLDLLDQFRIFRREPRRGHRRLRRRGVGVEQCGHEEADHGTARQQEYERAKSFPNHLSQHIVLLTPPYDMPYRPGSPG